MTYVLDLSQSGPIKSVGYLARGYDYAEGETLEAVFDRLANLVLRDLAEHYFGSHQCDLGSCGLNQPQADLRWRGLVIPRYCSADIFVPDKAVVYQAPSLILHYIRSHRYLPPACFVEAVLNCPEPSSDEYRSAIKRVAPKLMGLLDF